MPYSLRLARRMLATLARRPRAPLRRGLGDRRGVAAVEFAFVVLPMLMTICAIIEVGYCYFVSSTLDRATYIARAPCRPERCPPPGSTAQQLITQFSVPAVAGVLTCSNIVVNMTIVPPGESPSAYYGYVNAAQSNLNLPPTSNAAATFCPGAAGQYIALQVIYPTQLLTGVFTARTATTVVNGKNSYWMTNTAAFMNEPFVGAATYAGC